jgi:hypothetical protein
MSVKVVWDDEQHTALRYDLEGRWTWDEFYAAFNEGKAMMEGSAHTVHFILNAMDNLSKGYVPPGALSHVASLNRNAPPNAGITVAVGGNTLGKIFHGMIARIYPKIAKRYAFADSLEEARAMIAQRRQPEAGQTAN